jgi:putative colanic acid biosynthesis UDP-glucose lipid carrier transferase
MAFHDDKSTDTPSGVLLDTGPAFGLSLKRVFDIIGAAIALTLLAPLIAIIAAAIVLDSRGPIFSRQTIYGYRNRAISTIKFRSTTARTKENCNSCVTWVGHVLLRTGLNELPKLFNVLRGEMTIVGPRPYDCPQDFIGQRIAPLLDGVKPGLTGWEQIIECRRDFVTIEQRIKGDLQYIENRTLLLDIKIIMMTTLR